MNESASAQRNVSSTCRESDTAHAVVCFIIYFLLGFFGAARWGLDTNTNLLVNDWGPPAYQGALNILLGVYLALTNPPLVYPVAHILRVRSADFGNSIVAAPCLHRLMSRSYGTAIYCSAERTTLCIVLVSSACRLPSGLAARQGLWMVPALHHHLSDPHNLPSDCTGSAFQFFSGMD